MTDLVLGEAITLKTQSVVVNPQSGASVLTDDTGLELLITKPDGTQTILTQPTQVVHDSTGVYHAVYTPGQIGIYTYRWLGQNVADAAEGTFNVESIMVGAVTDVRDLRVLIPACRRAIDGPQATTSDAPSTTLTDLEVLGLVADATAELILHTASQDGSDLNAFGNQLIVVSRDPFYMAPNAWRTDQPRSTAQDAAILSQAALDHYFWLVKQLKVSESIKNEAQEWSYTMSASVIAAWIQHLITNRDRAVAALQTVNVVMDTYVSLVAERDRMAAAWLEPWVSEVGAPVPYAGGGGSGPLEYDYRFNTWG